MASIAGRLFYFGAGPRERCATNQVRVISGFGPDAGFMTLRSSGALTTVVNSTVHMFITSLQPTLSISKRASRDEAAA